MERSKRSIYITCITISDVFYFTLNNHKYIFFLENFFRYPLKIINSKIINFFWYYAWICTNSQNKKKMDDNMI